MLAAMLTGPIGHGYGPVSVPAANIEIIAERKGVGMPPWKDIITTPASNVITDLPQRGPAGNVSVPAASSAIQSVGGVLIRHDVRPLETTIAPESWKCCQPPGTGCPSGMRICGEARTIASIESNPSQSTSDTFLNGTSRGKMTINQSAVPIPVIAKSEQSQQSQAAQPSANTTARACMPTSSNTWICPVPTAQQAAHPSANTTWHVPRYTNDLGEEICPVVRTAQQTSSSINGDYIGLQSNPVKSDQVMFQNSTSAPVTTLALKAPMSSPEPWASITDIISASQFMEYAIHATTATSAADWLTQAQAQMTNTSNYFKSAAAAAGPMSTMMQTFTNLQTQATTIVNDLALLKAEVIKPTTILKTFQTGILYPYMGAFSNIYMKTTPLLGM
jgi:hypothetical protein